MNKFDLLDSIGEVDDEMIENAKRKKLSTSRVWITIGLVAACACIACVGVLMWQNMSNSPNPSTVIIAERSQNSPIDSKQDSSIKNSSNISSEGSENSQLESEELSTEQSEEIIYQKEYKISYVKQGKIVTVSAMLAPDAKTLFNKWKQLNGIGDEVQFVSAESQRKNTESVSEFSGEDVAVYNTNVPEIYTLTITKNIENYYDKIDKDLLLESLQKTMTESCWKMPEEYHLVLVDEPSIEPSDEPSIDFSYIQYNDKGEILE